MERRPSETHRPPSVSDELDQERILKRIPGEIIAASAVLAVPVGLIFGLASAFVFTIGGILSAVGFAWLKQSLNRFLDRGRRGALRSGILMYLLRLLLICGAFLIIILIFPRRILAFGAGFSVIVPVFLIEGVRAFFYLRTWKT